MKKDLWVWLLLLCAPPLWATSRAQMNCNIQRLASVDMVFDGQLLVPVDYSGQTVWMVLDLAQPFSLLSPSAVAPLKLRMQNIDARPGEFMLKIDGKPVTETVDIDSLRIGNYRLSRHSLFVDPRPALVDPRPGRIVFGTLGMRDLWPVDFELDLVHHQLNLYSSDHCTGAITKAWGRSSQIPMELNEFGSVVFPIEADGTKVVASISTRSAATFMGADVGRQIFGPGEQSSNTQSEFDGDRRGHDSYRLMTLVAGDLRLPNMKVLLVPHHTACSLSKDGRFGEVWEYHGRDDYLCFGIYPLVLGIDAIEHLRLYFATKEGKIYFAPAEPMLERSASR